MATTTPSTAQETAIRALLEQDVVWSAYALADLQPAYAPYCRWLVADVEDAYGQVGGLALIFTGLTPPVLFVTGAPAAVAQALQSAELPDQVYMSAQEAHLPVLERFWDFRADRRPMWRMWLAEEASPAGPPPAGLQRLGSDHASAVAALIAHGGDFAPDAFDAYQLADGLFFGVTGHAGDLLAVGGTHIVDRTGSVAAIGNMYTRPDMRDRGLGAGILAAMVAGLRSEGIRTMVLNVDQRNVGALRLYQRHGFRIHCSFWEGVGRKRTCFTES